MKHIKVYEKFLGLRALLSKGFSKSRSFEKEPDIEDYVICHETSGFENVKNFINNNIGQYIEKKDDCFIIKYENVPREMAGYFTDAEGSVISGRKMWRNEILDWSKDKKELEAKLAANKYNI